MGVPQRALLTLPQGLVIGRSTTPGAGLGVFNQGQIVPIGMHFGPFDGEVTSTEKAQESAYSWMVSVLGAQSDYYKRIIIIITVFNTNSGHGYTQDIKLYLAVSDMQRE